MNTLKINSLYTRQMKAHPAGVCLFINGEQERSEGLEHMGIDTLTFSSPLS